MREFWKIVDELRRIRFCVGVLRENSELKIIINCKELTNINLAITGMYHEPISKNGILINGKVYTLKPEYPRHSDQYLQH